MPDQVTFAESGPTLATVRLPGGAQEAQVTFTSKPSYCTPLSEWKRRVSGPVEETNVGMVPVPLYSPSIVPLMPMPS